MSAELVDIQLRCNIRSARASGLRCIKAIIVGGPGSGGRALGDIEDTGKRTLALATTLPVEPGAALDAEFNRCIEKLAEDSKPCLLLFRCDEKENLEGCRWFLVAWVPEGASELDRIIYVRSRGLLARLVPQPYYLHEFFANKRADLKWSVLKASEMSDVIVPTNVTEVVNASKRGARPPPMISSSLPQGPLKEGSNLKSCLQRLAKHEDACCRLTLVKVAVNASQSEDKTRKQKKVNTFALDAHAEDIRSPQDFARAPLPKSTCFFALPQQNHLLFVTWCPDPPAPNKDAPRILEDTKYASIKASVLRILLDALPDPKPYVVQIEARDEKDILEGAKIAADTATRLAAGVADMQAPLYSALDTAPVRAAVQAQPVPSTMTIDSRPFPHWRGGTKTHAIQSSAGPVRTGPSPAVRRQTVRAPPLNLG